MCGACISRRSLVLFNVSSLCINMDTQHKDVYHEGNVTVIKSLLIVPSAMNKLSWSGNVRSLLLRNEGFPTRIVYIKYRRRNGLESFIQYSPGPNHPCKLCFSKSQKCSTLRACIVHACHTCLFNERPSTAAAKDRAIENQSQPTAFPVLVPDATVIKSTLMRNSEP